MNICIYMFTIKVAVQTGHVFTGEIGNLKSMCLWSEIVMFIYMHVRTCMFSEYKCFHYQSGYSTWRCFYMQTQPFKKLVPTQRNCHFCFVCVQTSGKFKHTDIFHSQRD